MGEHNLNPTKTAIHCGEWPFFYAKTKGEYDSRLKAFTELYKNVEDADINAELTADLVGDYLFTDADFVRKLSTEHRNVFQKIFDEIKYLCKVATAGSKEARELEKVKKTFEDAYRTETKNTVTEDGVKYSVSTGGESRNGIDTYSEEQYNNFGWASYNEVITAKERGILFSRYADFKHNRNKYPVTRWGEAVMHSTECPDVIMYVKGSIEEPEITRIVRINTAIETVTEDTVALIREEIMSNEWNHSNQPYQSVEEFFGYEVLSISKARNYASFWEARNTRTEGRGGQTSHSGGEIVQDGTGSGQGGVTSNRADEAVSDSTETNEITSSKASSSDGVFFDAPASSSDMQHSLTAEDDIAPIYGNYNVSGKDIALENDTAPAEEDIAPVREDIAHVQNTAVTDNDKKVLQGDGEPAIMTAEASENSLTYDEEDALLAYKSGGSYNINAKLLDGDALSPYEQKIVDGLDSALEKLPVYQGKVYRNIAFDGFGDQAAVNELLKEYVVGKTVVHASYTSTSFDPNGYPVDSQFVVHYEIESVNGRDMQGYGNNMESEVLIPRNARFFVDDIRYDRDGTPTIYLTEMTNGGQTDDAGGSGKDIGGKGVYSGGGRATVSRDVSGGQNVRFREAATSDMQRLPKANSENGGVHSISELDTRRSIKHGEMRGVRSNTGRDTTEQIAPIQETPSNDGVFFDADIGPVREDVKEQSKVRQDVGVTRTGTFYVYDGKKVNGRYRVTNKPERVGKTPVALYVSGWVNIT